MGRQTSRRRGGRPRTRSRRWMAIIAALAAVIVVALIVMLVRRPDNRPAQDLRAVAAISPLGGSPIANLFAFGDSITAGYGLPAGEAWPYLVASRIGLPADRLTIHAVLGGAVMDWGRLAYQVTPANGDLSLVLPGYNDLRANGADPERLARYADALSAYVAWLALSDHAKRTGTAIRFDGDWKTIADYGRVIRSRGQARAQVVGQTVYVATTTNPAGGGFSIDVDGQRLRHVDTRGEMGNGGAASKEKRGARLVRIPGLGSGSHQVVVTTEGDGEVVITWIGGNSQLGSASPRVLIGDTLDMNQKGAGNPQESYGRYTEAARQAYANAARRVIADLRRDGLQVQSAATAAAFDPDVQSQADNVHPNMAGRASIAEAFTDAIDPSLIQRSATDLSAEQERAFETSLIPAS